MFAAPRHARGAELLRSAPLAATLDALVDWDLLNDGPVRLSVGAVDVESGNFRYFDTTDDADRRAPHHGVGRAAAGPAAGRDRRAAGSGTAASSRTRRSPMCSTISRRDLLVFQVDLFSAAAERAAHDHGRRWRARRKSASPAAPARSPTELLQLRQEREAIAHACSPSCRAELRDDPDVAGAARRGRTSMPVNLVQLIYRANAWEGGSARFRILRAHDARALGGRAARRSPRRWPMPQLVAQQYRRRQDRRVRPRPCTRNTS